MSQLLIIGHRGAAAVAPENTLASFEAAIRVGADGVEFDVRLSRDGVPVVIHDETLVQKARLADLKSVSWTVDDPAWVTRAHEIGVHALITNNPSALVAARNAV
jgi:glycerophosphoryl diester phosphodiesterase